MNVAYLLIGGNIGDRSQHLRLARQFIDIKCGFIISQSHIYETAAWGMVDQKSFLNQALKIETSLEPEELLESILQIELELGRIREEKYGPRIIDIDILLYNNIVVDTDRLTIPHPELNHRRFALQCLDDIASDELHPVYKKTIHTLLGECKDVLRVDKLD